MDKQAREALEMAKSMPFKQRVNHFWYYYKWRVIIIAFIILLISFTVYEVLTVEHYDLDISCFTESGISPDTIEKMEEYFSQYVEDINGDGKTNVNIYTNTMGPDAADINASAVQQKFVVELSAGSSMVYIFDQRFYDIIQNEGYDGVAEASFELTGSPELINLFALPQEDNTQNLYWVTKSIYKREADKEERIAMHDNALHVQEVLSQYLPNLENQKSE